MIVFNLIISIKICLKIKFNNLKSFFISILLFFTFTNVNAQWTSIIQGDGAVTLSNSNAYIKGANNGGDQYNGISFIATQSLTISFNWNYTTHDDGPEFDPFIYKINNGDSKNISDDFSGKNQSGSFSKSLNSGDIFFLGIYNTDGIGGFGEVTITNLNKAQNFLYFGLNKYGLITSDNTMQLDINGKIKGSNKINKNGKIN